LGREWFSCVVFEGELFFPAFQEAGGGEEEGGKGWRKEGRKKIDAVTFNHRE